MVQDSACFYYLFPQEQAWEEKKKNGTLFQ